MIAENNQITGAKPNQEVFSGTLQSLAEQDRNIVVVTSDSRGSGKLVPFGKQFPAQIVEVGIAEQNLVGISAGLAAAGKKVFAVSPACFLTARSLEQIKNDVTYSGHPVTLVGISAGVSYGPLGSTHHSTHDFAVLRTLHNLTIVAPADNFETAEAVRLAAAVESPVYLRFGKKPMPLLPGSSEPALSPRAEPSQDSPAIPAFGTQRFSFGKGRLIREGNDIALVANGETVYPAWQAALKLEQEHGIRACVVSMHTVKPLDYELLARLAGTSRAILTVEEHSIYGGLGEACASFLLEQGFHLPFRIMGIPDEYTVTGSQTEIFDHYGLSAPGIASAALRLLDGPH